MIMKNEVIVGKDFPSKVIPLIELAKKTIQTVVYDWRWYPNDPGNAVQLFNQAIVRAVKRGVKVEAISNYDNVVSILNANGIDAKKITVQGLVHAKLMIIDDNIVVMGSHNYTHNAFVLNKEISVVLTDTENIKDFKTFFESLWCL
jgi:phosphatidylserine/phosphatidylglycerophosphate/cardiolipin synthase-like enzyme